MPETYEQQITDKKTPGRGCRFGWSKWSYVVNPGELARVGLPTHTTTGEPIERVPVNFEYLRFAERALFCNNIAAMQQLL